jgi:hypothetical protein
MKDIEEISDLEARLIRAENLLNYLSSPDWINTLNAVDYQENGVQGEMQIGWLIDKYVDKYMLP